MSEQHIHSWLGSGITLPSERRISSTMLIRPAAITMNDDELRRCSVSRRDYGLLCALAPTVTFELETSAETFEDAAVNCWNNQYALIFLSVVAKAFVFHSIQVPGGYANDGYRNLLVSYPHCIPVVTEKPQLISEDELSSWIRLLPNFTGLLRAERFRFATSVASNLYVHPNVTIQVASIFSAIEALIDIDQELRFRISMTTAKLLSDERAERIEIFKKMKKLYDGRSKCVHGGGLSRDKVLLCRDDSLEMLRRLILSIVMANHLPSRDQLDDLLLS